MGTSGKFEAKGKGDWEEAECSDKLYHVCILMNPFTVDVSIDYCESMIYKYWSVCNTLEAQSNNTKVWLYNVVEQE